MSFGNKGGGCRTGRKYPQQVTAGMTDEHMKFLKAYSNANWRTLAEALRDCVERCMEDEKKPGAAGRLAG